MHCKDFTLPLGGSETSVSEFPGRAVGTPIELPPALPERSFLAFDPPRGRVKFAMQWMRLWQRPSNPPILERSSRHANSLTLCVSVIRGEEAVYSHGSTLEVHNAWQLLLVFELTARGIPDDDSLEAMWQWFDLAHVWIVNGFTDLTSSEIRDNIWKQIR